MALSEKLWRIVAALNGFMAVAMGALAAHGVADAHAASLAEKASYYQLIHAVLLLWLASQKGRVFNLSRLAVITGLILFCGSLYIKALTGWEEITHLAPLGGTSFMVGWVLIAFKSINTKS